MGVAPFNIASSVNLITAQRLARKLCTHCRRPEDIPPEALLRAGFLEEDLDGSWQPFGPIGCDHCKGTGYKGRIGVYEVMPITDDMLNKRTFAAKLRELVLEDHVVNVTVRCARRRKLRISDSPRMP